jgi:hypothetical protein
MVTIARFNIIVLVADSHGTHVCQFIVMNCILIETILIEKEGVGLTL